MRRPTTSLSTAPAFVALALVLLQPGPARTARAADINEKCEDCSARNFQQYEHCVAVHGLDEQRCSDQYDEGVIHCFRNFCEQ